jgi:hypothetical protein
MCWMLTRDERSRATSMLAPARLLGVSEGGGACEGLSRAVKPSFHERPQAYQAFLSLSFPQLPGDTSFPSVSPDARRKMTTLLAIQLRNCVMLTGSWAFRDEAFCGSSVSRTHAPIKLLARALGKRPRFRCCGSAAHSAIVTATLRRCFRREYPRRRLCGGD